MFFWAINSNPWKLAFWVLSYILYDPQLCAAILAETEHPIRPYAIGGVDIHYLMTRCTLLEAMFNETLRLVAASISMHKVVASTTIGDKTLLPGSTLLILYRLMHFSPKIFGHDAERFNPARFTENPELSKNPGFRPWE